MKKNNQKMFIVRKFVMAKDAKDALRKENSQKADEIWIDPEWANGRNNVLSSAIGFDNGHSAFDDYK